MIKFLKNRRFLLALRVLLGGIFVYAGILKAGAPLEFADSIATFRILPTQLINLAALGLPPFEILGGGMLIFGVFQRQATSSLLVLTAGFMAFLLQAIIRGLEVDCGCFGSGEPSPWAAWVSLTRNMAITAGFVWILIQQQQGGHSR